MKNLTIYSIVTNLIGSIEPIGHNDLDAVRLENLKELCELVSYLLSDINRVANSFSAESEFGIELRKYAGDFLSLHSKDVCLSAALQSDKGVRLTRSWDNYHRWLLWNDSWFVYESRLSGGYKTYLLIETDDFKQAVEKFLDV